MTAQYYNKYYKSVKRSHSSSNILNVESLHAFC